MGSMPPWRPDDEEKDEMAEATYRVGGMTCEHCVAAVREEVGRIDGVADVGVDLAAGVVTVRSEQPVADAAVRAAVEEAGYEVVA